VFCCFFPNVSKCLLDAMKVGLNGLSMVFVIVGDTEFYSKLVK